MNYIEEYVNRIDDFKKKTFKLANQRVIACAISIVFLPLYNILGFSFKSPILLVMSCICVIINLFAIFHFILISKMIGIKNNIIIFEAIFYQLE